MATSIYSNGDVGFVCRAEPVTKQVFLAGSFNAWGPGVRRMQKTPDGAFRARLTLPPGEHHYKFVIDGQWATDPDAAEQTPNPLGSVNSVVRVPDAPRPGPAAGANLAWRQLLGLPLPQTR